MSSKKNLILLLFDKIPNFSMNNDFNNIHFFIIIVSIGLICVFCGEPIRQIIKYTVSFCKALYIYKRFR